MQIWLENPEFSDFAHLCFRCIGRFGRSTAPLAVIPVPLKTPIGIVCGIRPLHCLAGLDILFRAT